MLISSAESVSSFRFSAVIPKIFRMFVIGSNSCDMNEFKGTGVALITPFTEKYEIDRDSLLNAVDYIIDGGVDFIAVLGTTSEAPALEESEKLYIARTVSNHVRNRIPLMIGIGGNNTREVIRRINEFPLKKDYSGILSVVPYYNKPSQEGIYNHFSRIMEETDHPLCLYNIPGRTGVNMTAGVVCRLAAEYKYILGIKEASGNFEQMSDILQKCREDFLLFSGDDSLTLPVLSIGGKGVISVAANIIPRMFSDMVNSGLGNRFPEARSIHLKLGNFMRTLFVEGNPVGIKAALKQKGIIRSDAVRPPLIKATPSLYIRIKQSLEEAGC